MTTPPFCTKIAKSHPWIEGHENPGGPFAEEINGFRIFTEATTTPFIVILDLTGIVGNSEPDNETNQ